MLITHSEIKTLLNKGYPHLTEMLLLDPLFIAPPLQHLIFIYMQLRKNIADIRYRANMSDCEDFALAMNARVHEYRMREVEGDSAKNCYQYAFGEAMVQQRSTMGDQFHMLNLLVDDQRRIYYLEPQVDNKYWLAGSDSDPVIALLHVRI